MSEDEVRHAVEVLERGGLIGLPTETVYGLAADASNPAAVARIFAAKGRPADHPVIVHVAESSDMPAWAIDIPDSARRLAAAFWPGPMTLILKRAAHVLDAVTGGQDTVGLRVPSHPVARGVLAAFAAGRAGRPAGVAAPSANKFGRVSPTTAAHVRSEFGDAVDLVLEGGQSDVGIESTIVDCTSEPVRILRPGRITAEQVSAVLGSPVAEHAAKAQAPRVSGSLDAHYAPATRTQLVAAGELAKAIADQAGRREGPMLAMLLLGVSQTLWTLDQVTPCRDPTLSMMLLRVFLTLWAPGQVDQHEGPVLTMLLLGVCRTLWTLGQEDQYEDPTLVRRLLRGARTLWAPES